MDAFVTALKEQLTTVGSSLTSVFTDALPIALPIIGGVLVITKGIGLFKKITNKA